MYNINSVHRYKVLLWGMRYSIIGTMKKLCSPFTAYWAQETGRMVNFAIGISLFESEVNEVKLIILLIILSDIEKKETQK